MADMQKTYDPSSVEERLYAKWEQNGYFHQEPQKGKKTFTIVMPPPNITGQLHMGHALDNMMQDVLTRHHRMRGENTLWLPGTDHASIATEATGMPEGICTVDRRASMPSSLFELQGIPITGRTVRAATAPAR